MGSPRAFEVFRDTKLVGYVGEGGGPFLSRAESSLGAPVLQHVRYTSLELDAEDVVGRILVSTKTFDEVLCALPRRGLSLTPAAYDAVFMPRSVAGEPRWRRA